ncbi:hypothetical protein ANTQUA_LOCUS1172 [Anthophora quadrimaculata]
MRVYKSTQFSLKFTTLQFPSREMLRMKDSFENQPGLVLQFVALNHHSTSSRSFFNTVARLIMNSELTESIQPNDPTMKTRGKKFHNDFCWSSTKVSTKKCTSSLDGFFLEIFNDRRGRRSGRCCWFIHVTPYADSRESIRGKNSPRS